MIQNFSFRNTKEPTPSPSPQLVELEPELNQEPEIDEADAIRRMFELLIFLPAIIPLVRNDH